MESRRSLLLLAASSLASISLSTTCLAFAPPAVVSTRQASLFSTVESTSPSLPTQSSLDKLEVIKLALKRPRGASVGVEYSPTSELSNGDLKILSMQLRKSKCAAIWTSDVNAVTEIAKEQEDARGDFPGPMPVIYCGSEAVGNVADAAAVVIEYGQDVDSVESGIIWKVDTMEQLQTLVEAEKNSGGVFLLSSEMLPNDAEEEVAELKEALSNLPKGIVTIAPLQSMLPENGEIALGKKYAALGISSLLLEQACVGDEEDIHYSQFAIEGINKKSSSSFSMTGLTGSTNGHFGVSSHSGETKWRRNE